jgi:hypothetical protein
VRHNFEIRTPRFPVGVTFSPDGRHVFFTMDSRPTGFGGMNSRAWQPCGNESVLMEVATGRRAWSLRGKEPRGSEYAAHPGFVAVSRDGEVTALADYNGGVYLVDKAGKIALRDGSRVPPSRDRRHGPTDGVGTWISDDGEVAGFGFKRLLMIAAAGKTVRVDVPDLVSGCVSRDGSAVVAGFEDGVVKAYAADGAEKWTFEAGGVGPFVAPARGGETLVATSKGELVLLDGRGKEKRRVDVARAADGAKHPLRRAANAERRDPPFHYRDPGTLEYARKHLAAKRVAAWKPSGPGRAAFGRTFHQLGERADLRDTGGAKECFLHLVYRKPEGNPEITVVTEGREGKETFHLDLPAARYRVVDVPVRGPRARAAVVPKGPIEVAECSLWSLRWPSANIGFVRPPDAGAGGDLAADEGEALDGDGLFELEEDTVSVGSMKDCKLWWPNTDVDRVAGPWLDSPLNPLLVVDGKHFGNGRLPPWAGEGAKGGNFAGAWFTVDFGKPVAFRLVAAYDRANRQSSVSRSVALLNGFDDEHSLVVAGVVENDQFWRLIPVPKGTRARLLGVLSFNGSQTGLSEIEVY